jgi:Flp pilus assembly pilin Flp
MLRKLRGVLEGARRAMDRMVLVAAAAERGASMVEYAILVGLVAIVAMVSIQALGLGIGQVFTNILTKIGTVGR